MARDALSSAPRRAPKTRPSSSSSVARQVVLHALWGSTDDLYLWGEDTAPPDPAQPMSRRKVQQHPGVATYEQLIAAVAWALGHGVPLPGRTAELTLLLPAQDMRPLPSWHDPEPETHLMPWRITALAVTPRDAPALLLALNAASPTSRAVEEMDEIAIIGESTRHFGQIAVFAAGLVARGRVFPTLARQGSQWEARWLPAPGATDWAHLGDLARDMPAICRAETTRSAPEGRETMAVLRPMVEHLVDAMSRTALEGSELHPVPPSRKGNPTTAAAIWLDHLIKPEVVIEEKVVGLADLAAAVDILYEQAVSPAGPVRTCFRLMEPPSDKDPWRVDLLLQSTEDPSLLLTGKQVWKNGPTTKTIPGSFLDHPQERMLEGLGHAVRLWPELEPALDEACPETVVLDVGAAGRFLRDVVPVLQDSGFGVLLPTWWNTNRARITVRLQLDKPRRPGPRGGLSGGFGLDALCAYEWQISLGDTTLTRTQLQQLARLKQPLVQMRGQWVEVDDATVEAALALIEGRVPTQGTMSIADAFHLGAGLTPSPTGIAISGITAKGWMEDLIGSAAHHRFDSVGTPEGFVIPLRPYQERGLGWLSFLGTLGLGGCLADDMGLGKTAQLLALLISERSSGKGGAKKRSSSVTPPSPTLVVCPMSVVGNWQREAQRFAPSLRVHVHHGADRHAGEELLEVASNVDVVITTYGLVQRDIATLSAIQWGRVVLDEAQAIKNHETQQSRAVRSLAAQQRLALTGTPVENRLSELWSIMDFCNPGLLGSASNFQRNIARPIERYGDEASMERLRTITAPFVLRRMKTDRNIITDLPEKLEMKTWCTLTREQASLYQAVVDDMLERIESSTGMARKALVLTTMLKLKQVCNHPAHFLQDGSQLQGRSGKLEMIEELLNASLASAERTLCFTQFTEFGTALQQYLERRFRREVLWLHGGTSKLARDRMVERFQSTDGPGVFLLSLKAGGTGLNLTAASQVIHIDRWWNPAVEDQATDRAYRIGQKQRIQVRKLICLGTLEERIDEMIEKKKVLAERSVGTGEKWLTELSTDALAKVIHLSKDAVAEG